MSISPSEAERFHPFCARLLLAGFTSIYFILLLIKKQTNKKQSSNIVYVLWKNVFFLCLTFFNLNSTKRFYLRVFTFSFYLCLSTVSIDIPGQGPLQESWTMPVGLKTTSSRARMCIFLLKLSEWDSKKRTRGRDVWRPVLRAQDRAAQPEFSQKLQNKKENAQMFVFVLFSLSYHLWLIHIQ